MDKTLIALINPISGRGHLDAYARLYSRTLCEMGYRVALLADGDGGAIQTDDDRFRLFLLSSLEGMADQGFPRLDRSNLIRSLWERLAYLWKTGGVRSIASYAIRVARNLALTIAPSLGPGVNALLRRIAARHGQIPFERYVKAISEFTRTTNETPRLIVFLYLDMMQRSASAVKQLETLGAATGWVGILFHPRALGPGSSVERYFTARNSRGGIVLVPSAVETYERSLVSSKFIQVPDIADLDVAEHPPDWIKTIRIRARGRTIVLLVGSIAPQKGIINFIEVIRLTDPRDFFFAVVGEALWESFGDTKNYVRNFFATPRENLVTHFGYVDSEADYNALICACDVIYAVYAGFNSSSNSLTKAAGLRRRILVSKGTLMGDRVIASGIGAVAPEDSPEEIHDALRALAARPESDFDFDRYATEHSSEALKAALAQALPVWLRAESGTRTA